MKRILLIVFAVLLPAAGVSSAGKAFDIYFIDVEGGQATLLVSPSGQTMLIDTGFAGGGTDPANPAGRDAGRIIAAAKLAHVNRIDTVLITHHHGDHEGGSLHLVEQIPVGVFLDHGPSVEPGGPPYAPDYAAAFAKSKHRVVQAGDKIPLKGLDVTVVISSGKPIDREGPPNQYCEGLTEHKEPAPGERGSEDPQSVGVVVQYGKFRFANFGDMTWNKEIALLCPHNRVGEIDVYETAHHGIGEPSKAVYAMAPRVAVMDNGARKGGGLPALKAFQGSPGLLALYQLHFNIPGGDDANPPKEFIANLDENDTKGNYLKASAMKNGSFTVYNARTNTTKTYPPR